MAQHNVKKPHISNITVIDLVLIDHRYLKECVAGILSEQADRHLKITVAKGFLEALQKHAEAESKEIYKRLEANEEFHFDILEAQIEHNSIADKIKQLAPKLLNVKNLKDETEAELKELAEIVKHHLDEEEGYLLPKMSAELEEDTLRNMGDAFMKARQMRTQDLANYPHLHDELVAWKDDAQKVSSQFLSKTEKFIEDLKH